MIYSQVKKAGVQHAWSIERQEYRFKKTRSKRWTTIPAKVWIDHYANVQIKASDDIRLSFSRSSKFENLELV
jgi:hypothetical protein